MLDHPSPMAKDVMTWTVASGMYYITAGVGGVWILIHMKEEDVHK